MSRRAFCLRAPTPPATRPRAPLTPHPKLRGIPAHQGGFTCEANDPYCTSKGQVGNGGDNWGGGSLWYGTGQGSQIYPFPMYYYARFVESQGDGNGDTEGMFCSTVMNPVGACGGVAAQGLPNCTQPKQGVAPSQGDQACFNRITDLAISLANGLCKGGAGL